MGTPLRNGPLGSIVAKLGIILFAMGAATTGAILVGLLVFGSLSKAIDGLNRTVIPQIQSNLMVIEKDSEVQAAVAEISQAQSIEDLRAGLEDFATAMSDLMTHVAVLDPRQSEEIAPMLDALNETVEQLDHSRKEMFEAEETLAAQVDDLLGLVAAARELLAEQSETARDELAKGSAETIDTVRSALETLAYNNFGLMQEVLSVRSETNLIIGAALAATQSRDAGFVALLDDLVAASADRLGASLEALDGFETELESIPQLQETGQQVAEIGQAGLQYRVGASADLLSLRQSAEVLLSEIIDTLSFDLIILSEDTAAGNEAAISALISDEVGRIQIAADVNSRVETFFRVALLGIAARDVDRAEARLPELADAAADVQAFVGTEEISSELSAVLEWIVAAAAPETGVVAARIALLQAELEAETRADEARERLGDIAAVAHVGGEAAMDTVLSSGQAVQGQAEEAQKTMLAIGVAGAFILALAPVVTWLFILRPMARLTRVTERLATGDLAPVSGFERVGGEIGRMARALAVFRDGMIERQEMQVQEAERQRAALAAEQQALEEKQKAEAEAAAQQARQETEERARREEEAARQAEIERAANAERDARAREQEAVVSTLSNALDRLSEGDLTVFIDSEFAEAYEGLRRNFNAAVGNLSSMNRQVLDCAQTVNHSSDGIASTARELAVQTETNATQLEQTSIAITNLDSSARHASDTAQQANRDMTEAQREATSSKETMDAAVATMSKIEESSQAISRIVDLIEGIAFQTNLLALNAGVEAARAGEHGRGFSVVAMEVRALAQRSSDAAGEINALITKTNQQVSTGAAQVEQAGLALAGISKSILDVSEHIASLAAGSHEQSSTITAIRQTVTDIERTTQSTAAMFEESLAASDTLNDNARTLMEIASRFRTETEERGRGVWAA